MLRMLAWILACARPTPVVAQPVAPTARPADPAEVAWIRNLGGSWYARVGEAEEPPASWEVQSAPDGPWDFRGPVGPASGAWVSGEARCRAIGALVLAEEWHETDAQA